MTVFRATLFLPDTAKAHEVPEPAGRRIPGVLDIGSYTRCQWIKKGFLAGCIESAGQQKRPRIIIDAIAVRAVRNGMDCVLEKSGIVTHRQKMTNFHIGRRNVSSDGCSLFQFCDPT